MISSTLPNAWLAHLKGWHLPKAKIKSLGPPSMHALWGKQLEYCGLLRKKSHLWGSSLRGTVARNKRQLLCPESPGTLRGWSRICFMTETSEIYRNSNKGSLSSK